MPRQPSRTSTRNYDLRSWQTSSSKSAVLARVCFNTLALLLDFSPACLSTSKYGGQVEFYLTAQIFTRKVKGQNSKLQVKI